MTSVPERITTRRETARGSADVAAEAAHGNRANTIAVRTLFLSG
jgi:hypothetical protein